jgi:hypothetical protein
MLAAFIATALATVSLFVAAVTVGASRTIGLAPNWGSVRSIPGLASLNQSFADAAAISCPVPGNCAAGGSYATEGDPLHASELAFVVNESHGIWGDAQEVPGIGALTVFGAFGGSNVTSISCAAAGSCAAVGTYTDAQGALQDFVVDESSGVWGNAQEVPGLGALNLGGRALVRSVSCGAVGDCAAVGGAWDASRKWQGYVVDESNGTWGTARDLPGPASMGVSPFLAYVSCAAASDCSAVGGYTDSRGDYQGMVVDESNGAWGLAHDIPGLVALNAGGSAQVDSISCAAGGECAAAGQYKDSSGAYQGFVVDESNGTWGAAEQLPGLGVLNVGKSASVLSVSCAAVGSCVAVGSIIVDAHRHTQGFISSEANGTWSSAQEIPGHRGFGPDTWIQAVSCGATGDCAAVGSYDSGAFVVDESNGVWDRAEGLPGLSASAQGGINAVSCVAAHGCVAVGDFVPRADGFIQGFVVSRPGTPPRCSPAAGLTAAASGRKASPGSIDYRIVYTNHGVSACELTGIPGALGFVGDAHIPVGPPATRTMDQGRGGTIYLEQLGGQAETTFVIHTRLTRSKSCRPEPIVGIIIRPMGVPQMLVPIASSNTLERTVCRGLRSEAIYGFAAAGEPLP